MTPTGPSVDALGRWLAEQRWYAGRTDVAPDGPVTVDAVDLPTDPPVAVGLVTTAHGDRYQLLVPGPTSAATTARGTGPDAAHDPAVLAALGRFVASGATAAAEPAAARVTGHWLPAAAPLGEAPARPLGAEQSNTSAAIGGTHVLKAFRRLQAGPHPELEIGHHLAATDLDGRAPVARLSGWYELVDGEGTTALGVVQELVPGALDGWGLVLSALAGDPGGLLARLHDLGAAVAHLHGALAAPAPGFPDSADATAPEAFGAVPFTAEQVAAVAQAVAADAQRLLATSIDRPDALAPVVGRAGDVAGLAADLAVLLTEAPKLDLGAAIRHHGDLHLGQTVVGPDGWVVLDFEGEPHRPLAERRERHTPLRDVAGMLRSFAYAAATHRRTGGPHLPDGWEPAARAAFLDGYLAAVDPALVPASAATTRTLLTLLELEKVTYEIGYELAHRPDWVELPVAGLRRLLPEGPTA